MENALAFLIAGLALATLMTALVYQFLGKLRASCWLLLVFPVILSVVAFLSFSSGTGRDVGTDLRSDQNMAIFCISLLCLSVFAVLRPRWRWLFWLAWLPNAIACGTLVYLVLFWHVFS